MTDLTFSSGLLAEYDSSQYSNVKKLLSKKNFDENITKKAVQMEKEGKDYNTYLASAEMYENIQKIKANYPNSYYIWLPSYSLKARPEHQILYDMKFKVGQGDVDGNMPGEAYGCKCGLRLIIGSKDKTKPVDSILSEDFLEAGVNSREYTDEINEEQLVLDIIRNSMRKEMLSQLSRVY
jgi:hypothetical protein